MKQVHIAWYLHTPTQDQPDEAPGRGWGAPWNWGRKVSLLHFLKLLVSVKLALSDEVDKHQVAEESPLQNSSKL